MLRALLTLIALAASLTAAPSAFAKDLLIAAAADLVYCLNDLNAAFKKEHPEAIINVSNGSSGNFFAQIQNGAPFDVFLSADLAYPRKLAASGQADASTILRYAVGRIAVWTMNPKLDIKDGTSSLTQAGISRVAIANPAHAPYGMAARAAMQKDGVWEKVSPKIVMGENISQTAQFVQTGNVDAGIVALSLLKSPKLAGVGKYVEIPLDRYPPLEQGAVITKHGEANPLAKQYMTFLSSPQARAIFDRYGFLLPPTVVK